MIQNPVDYLEEHQELISEFEMSNPKDPNYWADAALGNLRSHVKQHYIGEQTRICCYCKREYPTRHGRVWDTEHIQPRSLSPQFMFTPENLAASCIDCNRAKDNKQVLDRNDRVRYPTNPRFFKLVHPHFDRYEEHIKVLGGKYYLAFSEKGSATIFACHLYRFAGDGTLPIQLENRQFERIIDRIFGGTKEEAEDAIQDVGVLIDAARRRDDD